MKTKLTVIVILATLVSACTTGTYMTKAYDDDIYFSPADTPPVAVMDDEAQTQEKSARIRNNDTKDKKIIISQMDRNADGTSSVNNYIYQPDENENPDNQSYNMDNQELAESDTTIFYNDDEVKYVINNYYDENDNDLDFSYRINRFHRPYFYSPFMYDDWMYGGYYSPWYSGYYGMGYGWGYDGWYGGFGYPYSYYGGYYSPFSFGFGGYWGYGGYGGYYGGYNGYYGGYYGGGGFYNNNQVARRRATDMNLPNGSNGSNKSAIGERSSVNTGRANSNSTIDNGHSRTRSINTTGDNQDVKNATIVNDRRTNTGSVGRQVNSQTQSGNARRVYEPTTTGRTYDQGRVVRQSQNYTPSYNKPRIVNQSNYNNSSYTRPRTAAGAYDRPAVKSTSSGSRNQTYTEPRSSSNMRQTYRSSSSYSPGSSSSGTRNSSSYNRSSGNSGSTYSAPSRSSSSGSSSYGGGSSSSGSSSGGSSGGSSSSGGGGGSGSRR